MLGMSRFVLVISVAVIAAISTTVISMNMMATAGPSFVSGQLSAVRAVEWSELRNDATKAQFAPLPTTVIDGNAKLKAALEGADRNYEILSNSKGYGTPVGQAESIELTEEEANTLISVLPLGQAKQDIQSESISKHVRYFVQNDNKFYILTVSTVGTP